MGKQIVNRTAERVAAMKLIYEWQMGGDGGYDTLKMVYEVDGAINESELQALEEAASLPEVYETTYVVETVQGVIDHADELDEVINGYSVGWKTDRMPKVDLAILRLGVYELREAKEPVAVIINEAVELANIYCGDKSGRFINGVLGAYGRKLEQK